MTNLTEQWKKGKLPEGDYYIKRGNGYVLYDNIDSCGVWRNSIDEDIVEVLAEVPSYDGFMTLVRAYNTVVDENTELKKQVNHLSKTQARQFRDNQKLQVKVEHAKDVVNIDTARQIKQLKDLLKECKEYVKKDYGDYLTYTQSAIYQEINQVLGVEK